MCPCLLLLGNYVFGLFFGCFFIIFLKRSVSQGRSICSRPSLHAHTWLHREGQILERVKFYSMFKIMTLMTRIQVLHQRGASACVFPECNAGSDPPRLCLSISDPQCLSRPRHLQRRTGSSHLNPISSKYVIRAVHLGSLFLPFKS